MKTIHSEELINQLKERVEAHLSQAIEVYQNLTEEELNQQPGTGGWSIAQCLAHLNTYGDYYIPEIEKRMTASQSAATAEFTSTWLGNKFGDMLDPDKSKTKMKTFGKHSPPSKLDGHTVVAKFLQQQENMMKLFRKARTKNMNEINIPISLTKFIKMRLGDTFRFIIVHNERHVRQANRVLDNIKSKATAY